MVTLAQLVFSGLMVGSVYALVALGIVLIYKSSGVFNLAVGEFILIMAYLLWSLTAQVGLAVLPALLITLSFGAFLGLIVERLALRPLIGQPILTLILITLAVSAVLRGVVSLIWGGFSSEVYPKILPAGTISLGGIVLSLDLLTVFVISITVVILVYLYFNLTKSGLCMRAVAENHQISRSIGIKVKNVFALTWAIGGVVAVFGGILMGSLMGVSSSLAIVGLKSLPVVLLGGLESVPGAIVGGLTLGVLETVTLGYIERLFPSGMREVFPFIVLILVLFVRPEGIFGQKRIERV